MNKRTRLFFKKLARGETHSLVDSSRDFKRVLASAIRDVMLLAEGLLQTAIPDRVKLPSLPEVPVEFPYGLVARLTLPPAFWMFHASA